MITQEIRQLLSEANALFGSIHDEKNESKYLKDEAVSLMREMQRLQSKAEELEREGHADKIGAFNEKFTECIMKLRNIDNQVTYKK